MKTREEKIGGELATYARLLKSKMRRVNKKKFALQKMVLVRRFGTCLPGVRGVRLEQILKVQRFVESHPGCTIKSAARAVFQKTYGGYPSYPALSAYCYSVKKFILAHQDCSQNNEC